MLPTHRTGVQPALLFYRGDAPCTPAISRDRYALPFKKAGFLARVSSSSGRPSQFPSDHLRDLGLFPYSGGTAEDLHLFPYYPAGEMAGTFLYPASHRKKLIDYAISL